MKWLLAFLCVGLVTAQCPDGVPTAMCMRDPCQGETCLVYPEAVCRPNYCGKKACTPEWFQDGKLVDCNTKPSVERLYSQEED